MGSSNGPAAGGPGRPADCGALRTPKANNNSKAEPGGQVWAHLRPTTCRRASHVSEPRPPLPPGAGHPAGRGQCWRWRGNHRGGGSRTKPLTALRITLFSAVAAVMTARCSRRRNDLKNRICAHVINLVKLCFLELTDLTEYWQLRWQKSESGFAEHLLIPSFTCDQSPKIKNPGQLRPTLC